MYKYFSGCKCLYFRKDANFRDDLAAITLEELKGFLCVWNSAALYAKTSLSALSSTYFSLPSSSMAE